MKGGEVRGRCAVRGSTSSLSSSLLEMRATRWLKRQVEMVSSLCASSGEMVATMTVLQLPPRESRSTEVSIELR